MPLPDIQTPVSSRSRSFSSPVPTANFQPRTSDTNIKCPLCDYVFPICGAKAIYLHWIRTVNHTAPLVKFSIRKRVICRIIEPALGDRPSFECQAVSFHSHSAWKHFSGHYRVRSRELPEWYIDEPDLPADDSGDEIVDQADQSDVEGNHEGINDFADFPFEEGFDQADPSESEEDHVGLNDFPDVAFEERLVSILPSPLIPTAHQSVNPIEINGLLAPFPNKMNRTLEQKIASFGFRFALFESADDNYGSFYESLTSGEDDDYNEDDGLNFVSKKNLPKCYKTIRNRIVKFFSGSFDFNSIILSLSNTVNGNEVVVPHKIFHLDLRQVIHRWINNPLTLKIVKDVYLQHTAPFFNAEIGNRRRTRANSEVYAESFTGSEWLAVLERAQDHWETEIMGRDINEGVLVLHLGLFWDGFTKDRSTKSRSASVLMVTPLEINSSLRWVSELNPIAPLFFVESNIPMKKINEHILPIYTDQLEALAKGVEMFCEPLGKLIKVFAFVTEIIGDHPGRAAFVELKGIKATYPCHQCTLVQEDIGKFCKADLNRHSRIATAREPLATSRLIRTGTEEQLSAGKLSVNFVSECLNWPGFLIPAAITADLFHSEIHGDLKRHFLKLMKYLIEVANKQIFKNLSESFNKYVKTNGPKSDMKTANFANEQSFCTFSGMTQYGIMRFARFCIDQIAFRNVVISARDKIKILERIHLFFDHVDYVAYLSDHIVDGDMFNLLETTIKNVHKKGQKFYPDPTTPRSRPTTRIESNHFKSAANRVFLTINSHSTYHYTGFMLPRHGSTSNFGTLAFESCIGTARQIADKHKSRHASHVTLLKQFYGRNLISHYYNDHRSVYGIDESNWDIFARVEFNSDELDKVITKTGVVVKRGGFYLVSSTTNIDYVVRVMELKLSPDPINNSKCIKISADYMFKVLTRRSPLNQGATSVSGHIRPIVQLVKVDYFQARLLTKRIIRKVRILEPIDSGNTNKAFY